MIPYKTTISIVIYDHVYLERYAHDYSKLNYVSHTSQSTRQFIALFSLIGQRLQTNLDPKQF